MSGWPLDCGHPECSGHAAWHMKVSTGMQRRLGTESCKSRRCLASVLCGMGPERAFQRERIEWSKVQLKSLLREGERSECGWSMWLLSTVGVRKDGEISRVHKAQSPSFWSEAWPWSPMLRDVLYIQHASLGFGLYSITTTAVFCWTPVFSVVRSGLS